MNGVGSASGPQVMQPIPGAASSTSVTPPRDPSSTSLTPQPGPGPANTGGNFAPVATEGAGVADGTVADDLIERSRQLFMELYEMNLRIKEETEPMKEVKNAAARQ